MNKKDIIELLEEHAANLEGKKDYFSRLGEKEAAEAYRDSKEKLQDCLQIIKQEVKE